MPRTCIQMAGAAIAFLVLCAGPSAAQEGRVTLALEEGKSGAVWDVALSPDGNTLYSCGRDSTAKAWNLATGENTRVLRFSTPTLITCLALAPDGRTLIAGDMNGVVAAWNTGTGDPVAEFTAHDNYITGLACSPDGRYLVSCGRNDSICVWDAVSFRLLAKFSAMSLWVNAVAISPDGRRIASAGQDGSVRLWDAESGQLIALIGSHGRFARALCFSRDGSLLISGGRDGLLRVWDVQKRFKVQEFAVSTGFPHHLSLDRTGKLLAVANMSGLFEIWEWQKNTLLRKLDAASYGSMAAAIDDKSNRMFSAHTDGSIKVWNLTDGFQLLSMVGFSDGQWLSFTPDGYYDCSAAGDRYVQWQRGEELFPLERYESLYKKPSTVEDALKGSYQTTARVESVIDPPRVAILSPRPGQLFSFGSEPLELVVELRATDRSRIEDVRLVLNGREAGESTILARSTSERSDTALLVRFRLAVLPGVNCIEAMAVNAARVKSSPARVLVNVESHERLQPNLFVLTVGVDQYAPALPDLTFAAHDARSLAETFQRQEGRLYTRVYSTALLNGAATKKGILDAIRQFPPMTSNDVLILFFSGHGLRAREGKGRTEYYFACSGAARQSIARTGLAWDDLARQLAAVKAGRVILFLDACHSGAVSEGASNDKVAAALAGKLGIVFASSSGSEYSFENRAWGHGAFTKALVDGVEGAADFTKNKVIDWSELQLYVTTTVKELTRGGQTPMIPRLEEFANFDLARTQ